jgi:hypothetical protein
MDASRGILYDITEHARKQSKLLTGQQFANIEVFRISENSKKYQTTFKIFKVSGNKLNCSISFCHINAYISFFEKIFFIRISSDSDDYALLREVSE